MRQGVIYDFGMNNGDDVEYYLLKGACVVGVEANRSLCEQVERRFADAIDDGRLAVLNVALADEESSGSVRFYIHRINHVLSQLPRPADDELQNFDEVEVPCRTPAGIVAEFGEPSYIKIDVEGFDLAVLKNLFAAGIFPPEISAESHTADIFASLVANGYSSFNLVDGLTVAKRYRCASISTPDGQRQFRFKEHSAGPFGEDILTPWEDSNSFLYTLANAGLGWKDIHASRVIPPRPPISHKRILARQALSVAQKILAALKERILSG
ncbi:MAG: FkbM family methyltransferase [Sphingomicrobium sp.]